MNNGNFTLPPAYHEPVNQYLPGSRERQRLEAELNRQLARVEDIPMIIGGQFIKSSALDIGQNHQGNLCSAGTPYLPLHVGLTRSDKPC